MLAVGGVAVWMLLDRGVISSASVFDSPANILSDANANDLELKRLLESFEGNSIPQPTLTKIRETAADSAEMVSRLALVSPVRASEAERMFADSSEPNPSPFAGPDAAAIPVGPVSDREMDALRERVAKVSRENRGGLASVLGLGFGSTEFIREYLRFGNLELPEPAHEGETIAAERIELLRDLNRLGAKTLQKFDAESVEDMNDRQQRIAYLNQLYAPMIDDVEKLTEQMYGLAEQRYRLPKNQVGNTKQYTEVLYYTRQLNGKVLGSRLAFVKSEDVGVIQSLTELEQAMRDLDAAEAGRMPSRIAAAEQQRKQDQEEAALREQQRQQRIAQDEQKRQQAIERQPRVADAEAMNDAAPPDDHLAGGGRNPGFGPPGFPGPMGPRFGPMGPRGRGGPGMDRGPGEGPMIRVGPGGMSGPLGPRYPQPPRETPAGGVTITMQDARGLKTGDVVRTFSRGLSTSASANMSNNRLTVRLGYQGPLEDVIDLIDFGKVQSKDEPSRTIVLVP